MNKLIAFLFCTIILSPSLSARNIDITIHLPEKGYFKALEKVSLKISHPGTIIVKDGKGNIYFTQEGKNEAVFYVSGYPGYHTISILNKKNKCIAEKHFPVKCTTEFYSDKEDWNELFNLLKWNIYKGKEAKIVRYQNQTYFLFSDWIRDHVNILKGKKYFSADIKDAINIFAENQADNGMIYDFIMKADATFWTNRFENKNFIDLQIEEGHVFQRVPVENDVEYWFVDGIYQTWKATDDDSWMFSLLKKAEKALQYDLNSEYVWSEKYQLIKRPFTIDTWDFMPAEDAACVGGDIMESIPGKSRYGIMHGDNTGFASACFMLAEMYEYHGQKGKADQWKNTGKEILERLNRLSWNGNFYRHFVDEEDTVFRNLGTNPESQVSLSNALALNRGIDHEKAVNIIQKYKDIQQEMPATSPGEFYSIYPPFQKGFHFQSWHYINGGVFPFIGGELAKGAYQNGCEYYGTDILRRIDKLLKENNGDFPYYYIGKIPERQETKFTPVSIKEYANTAFSGDSPEEIPGWTKEGSENDLSGMPTGLQKFDGVPYEIPDPAANAQKGCIGLASDKDYLQNITIAVNQKANSIYFLHTFAGSGQAGWIDFYYEDGTNHRIYVKSGKQANNWWNPKHGPYSRATGWTYRKAWEYHNGKSNVGIYQWGYNNPYPEKLISKMVFHHSMGPLKWFIMGISLSDQPVYFEWPKSNGEHLVNWNAASVVSAFIEGLAGIQDAGVSFNKAVISPKWNTTDADSLEICVQYPASKNYIAYRLQNSANISELKIAGVAEETEVNFLLPKNKDVKKILVGEKEIEFKSRLIENSSYVSFSLKGIECKQVKIIY